MTSGPEKGKRVPALKVFDATGPHEGKEVDYAADRKDAPTVYVFVRADVWDRPMARFLKKLDEAVQKGGGDERVVAVWVGGDADKNKEYLPLAQKSLQFQATSLTVFAGDKTGPEKWDVNSDAHLTAVVAAKGVVTAVFGYRSINETDVPAVHDALKKTLPTK
ncbi:hypothetical protein FRUB_10522 [Fimbriiglobus ruber]|uniref:Thioredoxin domain-containing protein n=1 Tax=Fimbriiglobus ruber TaxID=1908690 RepID=A0A225CYY6_9BACT|nr:hypothetical protein FRUB_10522 [Fimbriiglobus ruber]